MGLDNGIILKFNSPPEKIPRWLEDKHKPYYPPNEYHITYWRNKRNIRDDIRLLLDLSDDDCEYKLSIDDVKNIAECLSHYNKKNWISPVVSYKEYRYILSEQTNCLKRLISVMHKNPDCTVVFYDR